MSALAARAAADASALDQEESNHWSRTLIVMAFLTVGMATIFFLLRLYSRQKTTWKLAIEDLFLAVGLVFSYGLSACIIVAAFNGVGHNIWALPRQTQGRAAFVFWLGQKLWALSHMFVKLSIILLIRRLLQTVGPWQTVTTGLLVFTLAWGITAVVGNAFQCIPARYFWNRDIEGQCSDNQQAFSITIGSVALAEDFILLIIPILIVWRLRLSRSEKIRITILFSFGGIVCILSILRVIELIHYQTDNLTASGSLEVIWALWEINLGIICACVVLMRPVFHDCKVYFSKVLRRHKERRGRRMSSISGVLSFQKSTWDWSSSRITE